MYCCLSANFSGSRKLPALTRAFSLFKSQEDSQYAGVGAEYRLLSWLQLRAGYRADMKSNDTDVFTAGLGISPFANLHLDLAGMEGNDRTWGAVAQMNLTF
ncbi:Uncharacterised protein [Serratia quinivorans]|jgi:hypothetical protein|nr:Uncharacterised protein [Serratia quinivorans]